MPTFYITKGTTTVVCPTLVEKSLLSESNRAYIWVLKNDESLQSVYFTATEESTELQRYNKFTITEKTSPNDRAGEVELTIGMYSYKIYEIDSDILPSVIDLSLIDYSTLTLVEQGFVHAIPSDITNTEYPDGSITNTVYTG